MVKSLVSTGWGNRQWYYYGENWS